MYWPYVWSYITTQRSLYWHQIMRTKLHAFSVWYKMKTLETMASLKANCFKWAAQRIGNSRYPYMIQPFPGSRTTQIRRAGVSLLLRGSNEGLIGGKTIISSVVMKLLWSPPLNLCQIREVCLFVRLFNRKPTEAVSIKRGIWAFSSNPARRFHTGPLHWSLHFT